MKPDTESGKNIHWINFHYSRQKHSVKSFFVTQKLLNSNTLYSVKGQKILEYFFLAFNCSKKSNFCPCLKMWLNQKHKSTSIMLNVYTLISKEALLFFFIQPLRQKLGFFSLFHWRNWRQEQILFGFLEYIQVFALIFILTIIFDELFSTEITNQQLQ